MPTRIDAMIGNKASALRAPELMSSLFFPRASCTPWALQVASIRRAGYALVRPPKIVLIKGKKEILEDLEFDFNEDHTVHPLNAWSVRISCSG